MFDKEKFKFLLEKAVGDRNATEFSKQSGVNRTYISKFLNKKVDNPPSPEILKRLADAAHNNITYAELMEASGYIEKGSEQYIEANNDKEYKKVFDYLDEFVQEMKIRGYDYSDKSREELAELFVKLLKATDIIKDTNKWWKAINSKVNCFFVY